MSLAGTQQLAGGEGPRYALPQGMMRNTLHIVPKEPPKELLGRYQTTAEPIKKPPPAAANTSLQLPRGAESAGTGAGATGTLTGTGTGMDGTTGTGQRSAPSTTYGSSFGGQTGDALDALGLGEPGDMFQVSLSGRVPNGLRDSRGFLNTQSTTHASQRQALDEDALDAWNRARDQINEINMRRKEVCSAPLQTPNPDQWTSTTHRTHVDLLPFVERDTHLHVYRDPQARSKTSGNGRNASADQFGLTGTRLDPSAEGYGRPSQEAAKLLSMKATGLDSTEALRQALRTEQLANVTVSKNGTTARLRGALINTEAPTLRGTHVGGQQKLTSTYTAEHCGKDPMFFDGTTDAQWTLKELDISPEEREFLEQARARRQQRHDGDYGTTVSDTFTDPTPHAAEATTSEYRKSHMLDVGHSVRKVKTGVQVRAGNTERAENPTDIVPGHFTTTKMLQDRYFAGY